MTARTMRADVGRHNSPVRLPDIARRSEGPTRDSRKRRRLSSTSKMAGRRCGARRCSTGAQTAGCCEARRPAGIRSDSKRVSSVAPSPPAPITTYSTVATVWSVKPSTNGAMISTIVAAMSATPCRAGGRIRMMPVDQFVPIASRVAAPPQDEHRHGRGCRRGSEPRAAPRSGLLRGGNRASRAHAARSGRGAGSGADTRSRLAASEPSPMSSVQASVSALRRRALSEPRPA
jgi:hypothetical protein